MKKQFKSYNELVAEQERLRELAKTQQLQIKGDLAGIREELEPVIHVGATLKKFLTHKSGDLLANLGINLVTNGLIKKVILSKAGWLTRLIVPQLVKNYASHVVGSGNFVDKIMNLFSKNGKHKEDQSGMDAV